MWLFWFFVVYRLLCGFVCVWFVCLVVVSLGSWLVCLLDCWFVLFLGNV